MRLDPRTGSTRHWSLDHDVGAMALRKGGHAVLALDDGFYFFDFESGVLELIEKIDPDQTWKSRKSAVYGVSIPILG